MTRLHPTTHKILAGLLLVAGLVVYVGFAKSWSLENTRLQERLSTRSESLLADLKGATPFPSEKNRNSLARRSEILEARLQDLEGLAQTEEELPRTLDAIFLEWGYTDSDPARAAMNHFLEVVTRCTGPEKKEQALALTQGLALRMCRAGLVDFDHLTFIPTAPEIGDNSHLLQAYTLEFSLQAGVAEAGQFLQEWLLIPQKSCLIHPLTLSMKRVEPSLWAPETIDYSSPPVTVKLKVRITLMNDKG